MGKDFSRKTIGTRIKRPSPLPKNYYEWQRPPDILSCRKFDGFKKCYCKLKQRIMGEMGKEKCFVVPQDCIQTVGGVETPCNGLHASLLYFHYLNSPKFDEKRPKQSSKQMQKFLLHKHVTALSSSNRSPRPSKHMYPQLLPLSHYPLLELAVAFLEAVEFSSRLYVGRSLPLVIILRKGASSFHFCSNCFPGKLPAQISVSFKSLLLFIPQD